MKPKKITIAQFKALISPLLKIYGDDQAALLKGIHAVLKVDDEEIEVVNEAGEPVEIEQIILVGAPSVEETEDLEEAAAAANGGEAAPSEEQITASVTRSVEKAIKKYMGGNGGVKVGAQVKDPDEQRRFGFKNLGEQMVAIRNADMGQMDQRLTKSFNGVVSMQKTSPTTSSNTATGSQGGFGIAPQFQDQIRESTEGEDSLLDRTDRLPLTVGNSMTLPADENTDWDTTAGILPKDTGEGKDIDQSEVDLEQLELRLRSIKVLLPVTDELMQDTTALSAYIPRKAGRKINFKAGEWIVRGTGAGQAKGFLLSNANITVAKLGGQAAKTIKFRNITQMWQRMYGPLRSGAIWLINQDIEEQLFELSFEGVSSSVPAYLPANGLSDTPFATLMGRPVVPTQHADTLGTEGDIMFVNLKEYLVLEKASGIEQAESMHVFFDSGHNAFRFTLRMDGQSWWTKAIAPRVGSNTLSPFVSLATRS